MTISEDNAVRRVFKVIIKYAAFIQQTTTTIRQRLQQPYETEEIEACKKLKKADGDQKLLASHGQDIKEFFKDKIGNIYYTIRNC